MTLRNSMHIVMHIHYFDARRRRTESGSAAGVRPRKYFNTTAAVYSDRSADADPMKTVFDSVDRSIKICKFDCNKSFTLDRCI